MKTFKDFLKEIEISDIDTKLAYNDILNPSLWENYELKADVKKALDKIADEFIEFLKLSKSDIKDIILTGSNCNFNWTPLSDIDLHLVVDYNNFCASCDNIDFDDCMKAKKTLWNDQHDIKIYGYEVEVYVQPESERVVSSAGVYSLFTGKWLVIPTRENIDFGNELIKIKAKAVMDEIDNAIDNNIDDIDDLQKIKDKIKRMRATGLEKGGEFDVSNLAFKVLRNNGYLEKFSNYINNIHDKQLGLE